MFAIVSTQTTEDIWRGRLARAVDVLAGLATFLVLNVVSVLQQTLLGLFDAWRSALWHDLFLFCLWFGLFGTILAGHMLLARRGQTLGLALLRLHWRTPAGRPATRRLFGEPQFWCAMGDARLKTLAWSISCTNALYR